MKYRFIISQPVPFEEDRHHEFKEVKGPKPVRAITNVVDEYVVAYLNSDGGTIYWGIRDSDRVVVGVPLSYAQRDELRKVVTNKLTNIQPSIAPSVYQVHLHQIYENLISNEPLPDLSLVEVIAPSPLTDKLYFTGGNEAFVKTDAGKKKLSGPELEDEILRRLIDKSQGKHPGAQLKTEADYGLSSALRRARMVSSVLPGARILWVDDNPDNNLYERMVLKTIGIDFEVVTTTHSALYMLSKLGFDAVVSDMERPGDKAAGLELLHEMRSHNLDTPVVFYVGWVDLDRGTPPRAFGITSYPGDLIHYILDILERERL